MANQDETQRMGLEIFCCYARRDQALLEELKKQLYGLVRQEQVTLWADTDINAGAAWEMEIKRHLDKAQIILLLISADFLSSDYCYSTEMKHALQRHERGEACVIPVILRPADWKIPPLSQLQALPNNAEPVTGNWRTHDEAYLSIVQGVRKSVALWSGKETLWLASISSLQSGDYENALKAIDKIIELGFTYAQLYKNKGDALFAQKSYTQALEAYEYALSLNAQDQDLYEEAKVDYQKAIDLGYCTDHAYYNLGNACYRLGLYREATAAYQQAISLNSLMDNAYFDLGHALSSLQLYTEAAAAYAQAYLLKPDSQEYKQAFEVILKEVPELPGNEHYPVEVALAIRECYYHQDITKHLGLPQRVDPSNIHRQSPLGTQGVG